MDRFAHYDWPFLEERHRRLAADAEAWCRKNISQDEHADADATCVKFVAQLGQAGFLEHCVSATPDVRSIALLREIFAYHHGLLDFAFVMQGLGSGPIVLDGTDAQKKAWLTKVAKGESIAAFALSEPEAGSDVAAMATKATRTQEGWVLDGTKTWISNGIHGPAFAVLVKTDPDAQPRHRGMSLFICEKGPGFVASRKLEKIGYKGSIAGYGKLLRMF